MEEQDILNWPVYLRTPSHTVSYPAVIRRLNRRSRRITRYPPLLSLVPGTAQVMSVLMKMARWDAFRARRQEEGKE